MKILLENNCDIEIKTNRGETALFLACKFGHLDCIDYLIMKKADV